MTLTRPASARHQCGRATILDETDQPCAHLDDASLAALDILRFFFVSYSEPASQGWRVAFTYATACFGRLNGVEVAYTLMEVVEAVSRSRNTIFTFSNPRCPVCRQRLSAPERYLMAALSACRHGDLHDARRQARSACDGEPAERLLAALVAAAQKIDDMTPENTILQVPSPGPNSPLN